MLFTMSCLADNSGGTRFRLNIGTGAEYTFTTRYQNQFDSTTSFSFYSLFALTPSLNIGAAINSRFSLFLHYSHFCVFFDQFNQKIQQASYVAVAGTVWPSEKFSRIYLSYSLGPAFFWYPVAFYQAGLRSFGGMTTVSLGYHFSKHFSAQIDLDYLGYGYGASINRTTIAPGDASNTIINMGTSNFGDNFFDMIFGLSAFWDIF